MEKEKILKILGNIVEKLGLDPDADMFRVYDADGFGHRFLLCYDEFLNNKAPEYGPDDDILIGSWHDAECFIKDMEDGKFVALENLMILVDAEDVLK